MKVVEKGPTLQEILEELKKKEAPPNMYLPPHVLKFFQTMSEDDLANFKKVMKFYNDASLLGRITVWLAGGFLALLGAGAAIGKLWEMFYSRLPGGH